MAKSPNLERIFSDDRKGKLGLLQIDVFYVIVQLVITVRRIRFLERLRCHLDSKLPGHRTLSLGRENLLYETKQNETIVTSTLKPLLMVKGNEGKRGVILGQQLSPFLIH